MFFHVVLLVLEIELEKIVSVFVSVRNRFFHV
jgi:hypothetical protein